MFGFVKTVVIKTGEYVIKNEPTILTAMGAAGLVTSVVFSWKNGIKVSKELEQMEYESEETPTVKDKAKVVVPYLVPVVLMTCTSLTCFAVAHNTLARRNLALASAYSLSEAALRDYRSKVEEVVGKGKAKKIRDDIAREKIEKHPFNEEEVEITGHGDQLCYDALFGRYFRSDAEYIRKCQNDVNEVLLSDGYVPLNEFYYQLGLPTTKIGEDLGWKVDNGQLSIDFSSQLTYDNRPCLVIDYSITPEFNYDAYSD